jgi:hypothetical protein
MDLSNLLVPIDSLTAAPGPAPRTVRTADGRVLAVPDGWDLVPPGDPGLTRRVKAAGAAWTIQERRGRKVFSRGVWAPAAVVESIRRELAADRADPAYARRQASAARRRERDQAEYVGEFRAAVLAHLGFHPAHTALAARLADAVTAHATPVGSGTVARTERIPVGRRAGAAVTAWLRHRTTAYDGMAVPRVKGARRELRRLLARRSGEVLDRYRRGDPAPAGCPLAAALAGCPGRPGNRPEALPSPAG